MLFVSDDTWETYIFVLVYVQFMGIDLVTEEDSATVKCAVSCKTAWRSGNSTFMRTLNALHSKLEKVNSISMEHFPTACLGPVRMLCCF